MSWLRPFLLLALVSVLHGSTKDQLIVLKSPKGVQLADSAKTSLNAISALPYHLFGLDATESSLLADVSFLRRPRLLAMLTVACDACSLTTPANAGSRRMSIGADATELLLFRAGGLRRALRRHRLSQSVVAHTDDLSDSTGAELFADMPDDAEKLPALPGESSLPSGQQQLVAELRRAQEAVRRLVDSKLLADSQPDVVQVQVGALAGQSAVPLSVQRFVAEFVARVAEQLDAAAGGRAFVAMATVSEAAPLVRLGRSLLAAAEPTQAPDSNPMNLADDYDADFPVMFNLILWLSVVLALAVYAVAYSLWNIDPGKDSIIYRRGYAHAKTD